MTPNIADNNTTKSGLYEAFVGYVIAKDFPPDWSDSLLISILRFKLNVKLNLDFKLYLLYRIINL